jgi:DNA topoisomerase-1
MMLAQRLYEGIEIGKEGAVGLITYMRTDSTRISADAIADVRHYITGQYGAPFLPESANIYKSKKDAQDAHEAIRPTSMAFSPEVVEKYLAGRRNEALPAHLEPLS